MMCLPPTLQAVSILFMGVVMGHVAWKHGRQDAERTYLEGPERAVLDPEEFESAFPDESYDAATFATDGAGTDAGTDRRRELERKRDEYRRELAAVEQRLDALDGDGNDDGVESRRAGDDRDRN